MSSTGFTTYTRLRDDLDKLLTYHPGIENPGAGRPPGDTGPLLRASLVLLVTAWENYVEQAVLEAFEHVLPAIAADHTLLSTHLQGVVAAAAKKDAWSVTGDAWKDVAKAEVETLVGDLNNASSGQVEGLVAKTLGVPDMLGFITWRGRGAASVRAELVTLVDVRGEIVHKGRSYEPLNLGGVRSWRDFVDRVIPKFDEVLAAQVERAYGNGQPW